MKVTKQLVTKLMITSVDELDPISVVLEDASPGSGKILIEYRGKAYPESWNALGDRSIADFILSCDDDYLIEKIFCVRNQVLDMMELKKSARRAIIKQRRRHEIGRESARDVFNRLNGVDARETSLDPGLMQLAFGADWWLSLPTRQNPEYTHFCLVVAAIQKAIRTALSNDRQPTPVIVKIPESSMGGNSTYNPIIAIAPEVIAQRVVDLMPAEKAETGTATFDFIPSASVDPSAVTQKAADMMEEGCDSGLVAMDIQSTRINWWTVFFWIVIIAGIYAAWVNFDRHGPASPIFVVNIVAVVICLFIAWRMPLKNIEFNRMLVPKKEKNEA